MRYFRRFRHLLAMSRLGISFRFAPIVLLGLLVIARLMLLYGAWLTNQNYPSLLRAERTARVQRFGQCGAALLSSSTLAALEQSVALKASSVQSWMALARADWLGGNCPA